MVRHAPAVGGRERFEEQPFELRIGLGARALDAEDGVVVAEMEGGEVPGAERDARGGALVEIQVADDVAEADAEERRPRQRGSLRGGAR